MLEGLVAGQPPAVIGAALGFSHKQHNRVLRSLQAAVTAPHPYLIVVHALRLGLLPKLETALLGACRLEDPRLIDPVIAHVNTQVDLAAGASEDDNLLREVPEHSTRPVALTEREIEILRLAKHGHQRRDIAQRLSLSPFTVDDYLKRIYHKLGVHSLAAAIATAEQAGYTGAIAGSW